jgi:anaerobic magnesium-protoporphyrin IX monomethyl ester cyclase
MNRLERVALVFPYFRTRTPTEILFPPLGAASLAAELRNLGIDVRIFDCTFSTFEELQNSLTAYQPGIVGIYSMVTLSRNTFKIAGMVRKMLPESLLIAGGPLPTLYPERFSTQFDAVFRGESNLYFPQFCTNYFEQAVTPATLAQMRLESYAGLFINQGAFQVDNPCVYFSEEQINSFPLPDRSDFNHKAYQKVWMEIDGTRTTSLLTTLGCPFDCDFCSRPIFGNLFRPRNLDLVFEEIGQISALGYDTLWIADDNFTLSRRFLTEFCSRIAGMKIGWSCLSRVTGIDLETARMMKEAGCNRVYLGLESGSAHTLQLMNKKATLEEGIQAVHQFYQSGLAVSAFFIVGYPGETSAAIEETFKLALSLPLDSVSFNVPYPLPGSRLFERVSGIDGNADWTEENEVTFLYNSEFDPIWLRKRIDETMQAIAEKNKR